MQDWIFYMCAEVVFFHHCLSIKSYPQKINTKQQWWEQIPTTFPQHKSLGLFHFQKCILNYLIPPTHALRIIFRSPPPGYLSIWNSPQILHTRVYSQHHERRFTKMLVYILGIKGPSIIVNVKPGVIVCLWGGGGGFNGKKTLILYTFNILANFFLFYHFHGKLYIWKMLICTLFEG